jgi:DNA-binding IclR family transcriptional regulator
MNSSQTNTVRTLVSKATAQNDLAAGREEGVASVAAHLEGEFKKIILNFTGEPGDVVAALALAAAEFAHAVEDFSTEGDEISSQTLAFN